MINIEIINNTEKKFIKFASIKKAVESAIIGENIKDADISIVLLDNDDIKAINEEYLQHDYPTDVISFPLESEPLSGEIYIGLGVAEAQSREYKVSLTNELQRLAVHGTLHCIGYDDESDEQKAKMTELEEKYIKG